jgi:HEPN domain-containing protein
MLPSHPDERATYIDFVNRSFRDIADQDYVAARVIYRANLPFQFLWAAEQCLEKYLKAVFLFSGQSVRRYGHNIDIQLRELSARIPDIPFRLPPTVGQFIDYIAKQGNNRYFTSSHFLVGNELLVLDMSVWVLRRYCQDLRQEISRRGRVIQNLRSRLIDIHDEKWETNLHMFQIRGGWLEKQLARPAGSAVKKNLIWKNFYFGRNAKRKIRNFRFQGSTANTTTSMHAEAARILQPYVKL